LENEGDGYLSLVASYLTTNVIKLELNMNNVPRMDMIYMNNMNMQMNSMNNYNCNYNILSNKAIMGSMMEPNMKQNNGLMNHLIGFDDIKDKNIIKKMKSYKLSENNEDNVRMRVEQKLIKLNKIKQLQKKWKSI